MQKMPSFRLHFPQNSPLLQFYTFADDCKVFDLISGSQFLKAFSAFCRILNYVSSVTDASSHQCWFQSGEKVKVSYSQVRRIWGYSSVLSHCSLLRNPWPKPTGVLEHRREGETNRWFSVFREVSFWLHS